MPFEKGKSGNPKGRPRINFDLRTAARKFTQEALDTLAAAMRTGPPPVKVKAAEVLLDRGWGKAPQFVASSPMRPEQFRDMTDEQLQRVASGEELDAVDSSVN